MSENRLDKNRCTFQQEQLSLWGRLQCSTSIANIQRHLSQRANGRSLKILDVGGGNGIDAAAFAAQGHTVTLVDPAPEMLAAARQKARDQDLVSRISFHQAYLRDLPVLFADAEFDLVLCHHVLQYVDNVTAALRVLLTFLRADGILSLLSINRYSESYRQTLQQQDPAAALHCLDARSIKATVFDTAINVYAAAEIRQEIEALDCEVLGEYGVRCVSDYIIDNEIKYDPEFYAELEKLEFAMSDTYPYNLLARNFQVIGRKR